MSDDKLEAVEAVEVENALLRSIWRSSLSSDTGTAAAKAPPQAWPSSFVVPSEGFVRKPPNGAERRLLLDSHADTKHAHDDPAFGRVLHIFCQSWMGIRAAAGALPGRKLAIAGTEALDRAATAEVLALVASERISRIVFHGLTVAFNLLIERLARAGASEMVHLVYHGNVAQWNDPVERASALSAIELAMAGKLRRIHFMQRDYPIAGDRSFRPMLLNATPQHNQPLATAGRRDDIVFLPGADNWRKNLHVNAFGAALSPSVSCVMHYASNLKLPEPSGAKLQHANYTDRATTFALMARVGCTLNVSLVECHPMVGLESESVGTPCLRGRLHLDYGEDHDYVKLVQVDDPISPFELRKRLDSVLAVQQSERMEIVKDYCTAMDRKAIERYKEFLEL